MAASRTRPRIYYERWHVADADGEFIEGTGIAQSRGMAQLFAKLDAMARRDRWIRKAEKRRIATVDQLPGVEDIF